MTITQLPFPTRKGIRYAKDYILTQDTYLEKWIIPKGTQVKLTVTQDFGYVVLPEGTKDVRGFTLHRRVFRW